MAHWSYKCMSIHCLLCSYYYYYCFVRQPLLLVCKLLEGQVCVYFCVSSLRLGSEWTLPTTIVVVRLDVCGCVLGTCKMLPPQLVTSASRGPHSTGRVFHAHVWRPRRCEAPWAAGLVSAEPGLNLYLLIPRPGFPCVMGPRGDMTFASLWARLGVSLQAAVGSQVVQEGALRLKRGVCGGLRGAGGPVRETGLGRG